MNGAGSGPSRKKLPRVKKKTQVFAGPVLAKKRSGATDEEKKNDPLDQNVRKTNGKRKVRWETTTLEGGILGDCWFEVVRGEV